jgi:EF-P beta-lysylation protein EpmB
VGLRAVELSILTTNSSPVRPASAEVPWQQELRAAIRDPHELCRRLGLSAEWAEKAALGAQQFPVFVPNSFLARLEPGVPNDPLLRQVLPLVEESADVPGFGPDPVDEAAAAIHSGVLQKYAGRALLVVTGVCAVHCRYCFRRNFPYSDHRFSVEALDTIRNDPSITEVIASGGDPLMLNDRHFFRLLDAIETIGHVQRLRIHTRLPVVIPSRITAELTQRLQRTRLGVVMVLHINHANEIDEPLTQGVLALKAAGVTVLNQAVLLAGVNDDLASQVELSERLFAAQVIPYYLHLLDPVAGGHHFLVADERARDLYAGMRAHLPGYLVPRLARETPGQPAKDWLFA